MSLRRIGFNSWVARGARDTDALVRVVEISRTKCKIHDGTAVHDA